MDILNRIIAKKLYGGGAGGGSPTAEDGIIDRTLTEYSNQRVTKIGNYAFSWSTALKSVDFPAAKEAGQYCFNNCTKLANVNVPMVEKVNSYSFGACTQLKHLNLPNCKSIGDYAFFSSRYLTTLVLGASTVCTLYNTSAFTSTPIASGTGFIYVPDDLVDSYKAATNWSTYAAQIKPMSELGV